MTPHIQEENKLRELKEEQNLRNEVSWEFISKKLAELFPSAKTPKQCRERYINYLKFGPKDNLNFDWTDEDLDLMISLYLEYGSAWSTISSKFKNK